MPHRNWVEPLVVASLLPIDRPFIFVADGPTVSRSWWRRLLVRAVGPVVAISRRPGAADFAGHLDAVGEAIDAGAVVAIFSEVGPPSVPPHLRRLAPGVAHFARQSQALVVPVVFGGTHELYLGRRIEVRVLPTLYPPPPDSDRDGLSAFMVQLRSAAEAAAEEAHVVAEAGAPRRKRWRWLTGNYPRAE